MAQELDKQTNKNHPNADSTLADQVETLLKDETGNL